MHLSPLRWTFFWPYKYCMAQNGISTLASKQARQEAKLAAAATKRAATGRTSTLTINNLPTKFSGNTIVDNANAGGLVAGRPWS